MQYKNIKLKYNFKYRARLSQYEIILFQSYSKTMLLKITKLISIYNDDIGDQRVNADITIS